MLAVLGALFANGIITVLKFVAAAMTGSLIGAMYQAALVSIERGLSQQRVKQSIKRARDVALHGLLSVPLTAQRRE